MNSKEILNIYDNYDKLSGWSVEINPTTENKLLREISSELKKAMRDHNLAALSAPAIGYNKRVFCINFQDKEIKTFINPVITNQKGLQLSREESVLIPDKTYIIPRGNDIEVIYSTPRGKIESKRLVGLAAIIFQQMLDQLNGLMLNDIGLEIDEDYDSATDEEKQEIINMYLDSLDLRSEKITDEINSNPEDKSYKEAIDFMTSVYKGETILEEVEKSN